MGPDRSHRAKEEHRAATGRMRLLPAAKRLLLIIWPFLVIEAFQVFLAVASMNMLSAGRAYVNGESLWSKAHKDAVASLILMRRRTTRSISFASRPKLPYRSGTSAPAWS